MFGVAAIVSFAIALLMHIAGWGSGVLDVALFVIIGLLCLTVQLVTGWWPTRHSA